MDTPRQLCLAVRLALAGRSLCALLFVSAVGCASFQLPPFEHLAQHASARTMALRDHPIDGISLNRAAMLQARSQAEVKARLEKLWNPSRRIDQLPNYNGLLATRYSQLNTNPGPSFHRGTLTVQHLGHETRVEYIAAFHADQCLPLVVGTSGINGTVDGKITVDMLQDLYDCGEFHVVHLESVTSVAHEVRNRRVFAGGFPEGLLLYESIAELRRRPEYAEQISQVHLVGVSFGGLLCGVAAHCEGRFRAGVIDGAILAFSPPLDLKQLFQNIANFPYIHDRIHSSYLEDGLQKFRQTGMVKIETDPKQIDFDDYVKMVSLPYMQSIYPALNATFPELRPIRNANDVYALSSMRPFFGHLGVPYFYFYAYDDPVLSPDDHFVRMLANCPNPLVDGILLTDGGHLGFDTVTINRFTSRAALEYFRYWSVR